jgi:ABC-type nitrate/sulfonate/bicarbonate transport system substrate-binding protein
MPRLHRAIPLVLLLIVPALLLACGDDDDEDVDAGTASPAEGAPEESPSSTRGEPDEVVFMAGFKPQANLPFVGAYVAKEMGFFEAASLEVEIRHSNPGENFRFLAAGEVQFSTADATALLEKWTGEPQLEVMSLALIGQTGQQGFAVLAGSGIETPADWVGKTAGYKGGSVTPDYLAILEANGVARSDVEEVKVGFEPQLLTEGVVDVFPVFVANEPDTLERLGYETRVFTAADYGAPTLGLSYIAMRDYVIDNQDIVERFTSAVIQAVRWTDENREAALDIVMEYAPQEDREHQRYMLETELAMAKVGQFERYGFGGQALDQWQALHDFLVEYQALPAPIEDLARVFTNPLNWKKGGPRPTR